MNMCKFRYLTIAVLSTIMLAPSVQAGGLLGILGGDQHEGDASADGLITLNSGPASNEALVNVGLGGGDGNIANVNLLGRGGDSSAANATISSGGGGSSGGLLGGGVLGGGTGGILNGGGLQVHVGLGPADIDLDLLGGGGNGPNDPNNPDNPNNPDYPAGFGSRAGGGDAQCLGEDPSTLLYLFNTTRIDLAAWARASNVTIVPIRLCPTDRVQVAELLNGSGKAIQIRAAVASDELIATSLGRSSYSINRVAAVQRRGSQLMVYVY